MNKRGSVSEFRERQTEENVSYATYATYRSHVYGAVQTSNIRVKSYVRTRAYK